MPGWSTSTTSTGTTYELLCFTFYFAAFDYYLGFARRAISLQFRQWAIFLGLYICALDSKELAVTLPRECSATRGSGTGPKESARAVTFLPLVTLPYVSGN